MRHLNRDLQLAVNKAVAAARLQAQHAGEAYKQRQETAARQRAGDMGFGGEEPGGKASQALVVEEAAKVEAALQVAAMAAAAPQAATAAATPQAAKTAATAQATKTAAEAMSGVDTSAPTGAGAKGAGQAGKVEGAGGRAGAVAEGRQATAARVGAGGAGAAGARRATSPALAPAQGRLQASNQGADAADIFRLQAPLPAEPTKARPSLHDVHPLL